MIKIKLEKFEEEKQVVVTESLFVEDNEYVDVVEVPATLHFTYDGCKSYVSGNLNKKELVDKAIQQVKYETLIEEEYDSSFEDLGLPVPRLDCEDGIFDVRSISEFYNDNGYVIDKELHKNNLQKLADERYSVEVEENG